MCSATGMSRLLKKRAMSNTTIEKIYTMNEKKQPIAGKKLANLTSASRFDTITFDGIQTKAPTIPCKERHSGGAQRMDRLLSEEIASPEPLMKPRRRCSLYGDSHFDNIFAESTSSQPLAMPSRSI